MEIKSIFITLLSGFSFFIGYFITRFFKNEKKLIVFAMGFAFAIILGLCFFDLLPECLELSNKWIMIGSMIAGIAILKILDLFIPDHDHENKKESHIEHIGIISAIALFLHNILEGTAIYTTSMSDFKMGLFMALGVAFHNIPLGIQISSLIHKNKSKVELLLSLSLSSIIGVLLIKVFNLQISELFSSILISITFGMLIYILFFELLCEVKENIKNKYLYYGLISGVLFVIVGNLLH